MDNGTNDPLWLEKLQYYNIDSVTNENIREILRNENDPIKAIRKLARERGIRLKKDYEILDDYLGVLGKKLKKEVDKK